MGHPQSYSPVGTDESSQDVVLAMIYSKDAVPKGWLMIPQDEILGRLTPSRAAEGTQDYVLPTSAVPTGLLLFSFGLPRIPSWATLSRSYGTQTAYDQIAFSKQSFFRILSSRALIQSLRCLV
jgi:hypothetical protein